MTAALHWERITEAPSPLQNKTAVSLLIVAALWELVWRPLHELQAPKQHFASVGRRPQLSCNKNSWRSSVAWLGFWGRKPAWVGTGARPSPGCTLILDKTEDHRRRCQSLTKPKNFAESLTAQLSSILSRLYDVVNQVLKRSSGNAHHLGLCVDFSFELSDLSRIDCFMAGGSLQYFIWTLTLWDVQSGNNCTKLIQYQENKSFYTENSLK